MSAAEIIAELPKLTPEEREEVAQRLRQLIEKDDLDSLEQATVQMFQEMDKREAEDVRHAALRAGTFRS